MKARLQEMQHAELVHASARPLVPCFFGRRRCRRIALEHRHVVSVTAEQQRSAQADDAATDHDHAGRPRIGGHVESTTSGMRRVVSVCTGAFLLARAGLLDGRRCTTHWAWCDLLARSFPQLEVDPDPIFVKDGDVWTSAGVTAGMDLALALVAADQGSRAALDVARQLVLFIRRPGGSRSSAPASPRSRSSGPRCESWSAGCTTTLTATSQYLRSPPGRT